MTTIPQTSEGDSVADQAFSWPALWSAIPDFLMAAQFLLMWVDPEILGAQLLPVYVGIMIAEFIIIHSSVFLGNVILEQSDRGAKIRKLIGLAALYSVFFLGISAAFGAWYYFFGFVLLTINRLLGVILGQAPSGQEVALLKSGWAATTMAYLFGVFLTLFIPLPRFGITHAIQSEHMIDGEGAWIDEPHRAIAFGLLYFSLVGYSELRMPRWISRGVPKS